MFHNSEQMTPYTIHHTPHTTHHTPHTTHHTPHTTHLTPNLRNRPLSPWTRLLDRGANSAGVITTRIAESNAKSSASADVKIDALAETRPQQQCVAACGSCRMHVEWELSREPRRFLNFSRAFFIWMCRSTLILLRSDTTGGQ